MVSRVALALLCAVQGSSGFRPTALHSHGRQRAGHASPMAMSRADGDGGAAAASPSWRSAAAGAFTGLALALVPYGGAGVGGGAALAEETSAGFEEFAAQGGTMKADPSCFFDQCGPQSKACFSNPACLKGITCLGNCRGEQLCATQCFARSDTPRSTPFRERAAGRGRRLPRRERALAFRVWSSSSRRSAAVAVGAPFHSADCASGDPPPVLGGVGRVRGDGRPAVLPCRCPS